MSKLISASHPHISKEAFDILASTFPQPMISPDTDMDRVMYDAGSHYVVEWIRAHMLQHSIITGSVDTTVNVRVV